MNISYKFSIDDRCGQNLPNKGDECFRPICKLWKEDLCKNQVVTTMALECKKAFDLLDHGGLFRQHSNMEIHRVVVLLPGGRGVFQ